ncbi:MAG TPA: AraC family transcriptional regulator ligand-binding domain-containing protein [Chitinophagaceae bacterium]
MNNPKRDLILSLISYAVQRDIQAEQLCVLSGINLSELQADNQYSFTPIQLEKLWQNAILLSGDDLFGLHFGESLQLTALGIVGDVIKTSRTVGEALTFAAAMTPAITDLFSMDITQTKQSFELNFRIRDNQNEQSIQFRQTVEFFMVFAIHELDGLLLKRIQPTQVKLSHSISDLHEYQRILRCTPVRKTGVFMLAFDKVYWNEPITTANYGLQNLLLEKYPILRVKGNDPEALQSRIQNYLLANSYLGILSLEDIAANFNTSPRTLQRKLKSAGVSYQELADNVRKMLAVSYISESRYPIKQISSILGYNEVSSFNKAFRRWTGYSPSAFQNQADL